MMRASGLPSANTSRVAVARNEQPSKRSISSRKAASVGAVRAASRAEAIAASGAAGVSPGGTIGGRGAARAGCAGMASTCFGAISGSASRLIGSSPSAQSTPASR
jgi:hypothetical protein